MTWVITGIAAVLYVLGWRLACWFLVINALVSDTSSGPPKSPRVAVVHITAMFWPLVVLYVLFGGRAGRRKV